MNVETDIQIDKQMVGQTDRQIDRQTDGQTDRQMDAQTDILTDRQINPMMAPILKGGKIKSKWMGNCFLCKE